MFERQHLSQACAHYPRQIYSHLGLQEDKNIPIILYELVDFIEVIRIKVFPLHAKVSPLHAKVSFDRFGKELHYVSVCLGDLVVVAHYWVVALTLWLEGS